MLLNDVGLFKSKSKTSLLKRCILVNEIYVLVSYDLKLDINLIRVFC